MLLRNYMIQNVFLALIPKYGDSCRDSSSKNNDILASRRVSQQNQFKRAINQYQVTAVSQDTTQIVFWEVQAQTPQELKILKSFKITGSV